MLTPADHDVPIRIAARFDRGESAVATMRGLAESGFVMTEWRLFAWRGNGTVGPVPLGVIERILVDAGSGSDHLDILVVPRQAMHPPLVLTRRANELPGTLGFVGRIAAALNADPAIEELGPMYRFTFPAPRAT